MKIPLTAIGNKKVKIEAIFSTFNKHINKSDIAYVDYTSNEERTKNTIPLGEIFCDNIIVFTPIEGRFLIKIN